MKCRRSWACGFPRTLTVTAVRFFRNPDLNARTEGMAISIIISIIVFFLVLGYMWLSRRTIRQD